MEIPEARTHRERAAPVTAGEPYLYDVFISYRLIHPDRVVGDALQRTLEAFRTPRSLVHEGVPRRLRRVFRDRSELAASPDLESELNEALRRSRFLIVVCSKHTPESEWIAREVEIFRELGGGDRILLLLIDGEPEDSYPRSLLGGAEGTEPLAADIRAPTLRQSLRRLRTTEKLRLLAPILGVKFDDLWQRERRRRRQRAVAMGALAMAVATTVAGLAWLTSVQTHSRRLIAAVSTLSDSALRLSDQGRTGLAAQLALQAYRFDPDGKLGMQSRVYAALRRSLGSGHFNQTVSLTNATPNTTAVSGDGGLLAIGRSDGSIEVLALSDGAKSLATTRFQAVSVTALAFLPKGRRLVAGRDDGEVWLVTIDGKELQRAMLGNCGTVEALAVSPAGKIVAVGTESEGLCLLDPERPTRVSWRPMDGVVRALAFSADGKWLAAGRRGGVDIWAVGDGAVSEKSVALRLDNETVTAIAFSDEHLAAGSHTGMGTRISDAFRRRDVSRKALEAEGLLRIWRISELASGARAIPADARRVLTLAFSPDGKLLASGGVDGKIRLWGLPDPAMPVRQLLAHEGNVISLAFGQDGKTLISAGSDLSVRAWQLTDFPDSAIATDTAVLSLAFLGSDRLAAAVKLEQTPLVWDLGGIAPSPVRTAEVPGVLTAVAANATNAGQFAFGTGLLIGSTPDTSVRVWNIADGRFPTAPKVKHESDVDALAISATGRWLASAGYLDKTVKLLEMQTGQVRELRLPEATGAIYALALHPGSDPPVVALGGDGVVVVVDSATGNPTLIPHAFDEIRPAWPVLDLAFSADGALLATTAPDGRVRLWRTGEWSQPETVLEPTWTEGPVAARRLAFNRISGELAIGYQDGAIRVWVPREPSKPPLLARPGGGPAVQSIAYDPSGAVLAVGLANGGIEMRSTLQRFVAVGCAALFRNLNEREWKTFVGPTLDYMATCPRLPGPVAPKSS